MDPQYAYQSAPANFMPMMAGGGLAAAAQQVQDKGRGGDSMLVHMSPGEVKGLQALAMAQGGSLTINPTTGLPEAFKLKQFLPMLIGAALAPMTAGTSLAFLGNPMTAGLLVGGIEGLRTKSLSKGLMAGLGAYGGAGLTAGLTAAGSAAANTAAQAAQQNVLAQGGTQVAADNAFRQAYMNQVGSSGLGTAAQGAKSLFSTGATGEAARSGLVAGLGGAKGAITTAGALAAPSLLAEAPAAPDAPKANLRPYEFAWNPQTSAYDTMPSPGDTSERLYFNPRYTALPIQTAAQGGQIQNPMDEMSQDGGYKEGGETGLAALAKKRRSLRGEPYYKFSQDRRNQSMEASIEENFAAGGLPPRYLKGGGDGMSDSIKANIDGKQEARLADGEFVVPADVVSHLGNGSSNAGARKLYAMMDRIRKSRTGKTRQAPEVNAAKYMPA